MLHPVPLKLQSVTKHENKASLEAILKVKLSSKMQSSVLIIQITSNNADALCFLQSSNRYKRFRGLTQLILTSKEMKNKHLNILLLFPAFTLLTTVSIEKSSSVLIIHSSLYEMGVRPRLAGAFYYFIIIQFHKALYKQKWRRRAPTEPECQCSWL